MDFNFVEEEGREKEIDLLEYWRIILKRKWIIIAFAAVVLLFVSYSTFTETPIYRASASLLIKTSSSDMLNIQEAFAYRSYQPMDYLNRDFNTQLLLLRSKTLAERVAVRMNLIERPEFKAPVKKRKSLISALKNFISLRWLMGIFSRKNISTGAPETQNRGDPNKRMAGLVLGGLSASPIKDTRAVQVSYSSPFPLLAADIVNTVAEEFINYSIEMRYEATQQASDFLSEQIDKLKEDLTMQERELQRYEEEKDIVILSDRESAVVTKFSQLNSAYTQAQIDRIRNETNYRELSSLNVSSLPQFINNSLIEGLRTRFAAAKNEYSEKSEIYKPVYPEMMQLKARVDGMRNELRIEIKKAVDAAESEYRSAQKKEESLKELLDSQKTDVVRMNSAAILYNSLKIEVQNKRVLLSSLVARKNETMVSARLSGLKSSNIRIIDRAGVPGTPVSPNKKRNLMLALLVGLFGGIGLCFLLEYMDNTVKEPDDVEKLVGLPSLGVIPFIPPEGMKKRKKYLYYSKYKYSYDKGDTGTEDALSEIKEIELVNLRFPEFFISDDYRTIRTSILLSFAEKPPKTITITSALSGEGKTATTANLAVAFSQLKEKVLIIDADLRKPRLHRLFKVKNHQGLSGYLSGKVDIKDVFQKTEVEKMWIIPSGPIPPDPTELLNSGNMKDLLEEAKKVFDVILIDTSPLLAVVDPLIVSSFSDTTILVVRSGKVTNKLLKRAVAELKPVNAKIAGVIMNEVRPETIGDSYLYSQAYRYHSDIREEGEE